MTWIIVLAVVAVSAIALAGWLLAFVFELFFSENPLGASELFFEDEDLL